MTIQQAPVTITTTQQVPTQPVKPAPKPVQQIKYPVKIAGSDYVVAATPKADVVEKLLVYAKTDTAFATPLGEAQAEFKGNKWLPKAGTVKLYKR